MGALLSLRMISWMKVSSFWPSSGMGQQAKVQQGRGLAPGLQQSRSFAWLAVLLVVIFRRVAMMGFAVFGLIARSYV